MHEIHGKGHFSVEHPEVSRRITQIVHSVVYRAEWRDDFRQEALVHFHRTVSSCPGQSLSWYIQSCKSAMRDRLKHGKSIDSLKRCHYRLSLEDAFENACVDPNLMCEVDPHIETSVRDAFEMICRRLDGYHRKILFLLFQGYGVREVARKIGVPHQSISKSRQRIATIAVQIGIVVTGFV